MTYDKNMTFAWEPADRRIKILLGEGGYQFKMLSLKKMTGQCVWDGDIETEEIVSTDGSSKCEVGCDPPALIGNYTPGFVCKKSCTKTSWAVADVPSFAGSLVATGKAAK